MKREEKFTVQDGWTALHYAASHDHKTVVNSLLRHGADVNIADKVLQQTVNHSVTFSTAIPVLHCLRLLNACTWQPLIQSVQHEKPCACH